MSEHLFPMSDYSVDTHKMPKPDPAEDYTGHPNTVRVYRYSPHRVMLQIRGTKQYASVRLPFEVAQAIADALKSECLESAA